MSVSCTLIIFLLFYAAFIYYVDNYAVKNVQYLELWEESPHAVVVTDVEDGVVYFESDEGIRMESRTISFWWNYGR